MFNSIIAAVRYHSIQNPDKPAIADEKRCVTYAELMEEAGRVATALKKQGWQKGDFLLVECTQNIEYMVYDLACEYTGIIFVPFEKNAVADRVKDTYTATNAKCILTRSDYRAIGNTLDSASLYEEAMKDAVLPWCEQEPETVAEILFSTGTTGAPKGIIITNRANVAVAENIQHGVEMNPDSVELIPMPLSHSHGLRTCYANLLNGGTTVIVDGVMNVALFFELMEQYGVNALDLSPTLAKLLLKVAKRGLMKIQNQIGYIEIGTAVLDEEVKTQLKSIFPNTRIYNFYGSTEAGRSCVLNIMKEDFPYCIGYPSKNASFLIVDENRQVIESSRENPGLIAVSGSMMMSGYFNSEELTSKTVVEGILYTSDLGYFDDAGRLFVMGRADDIINYKGIKIAPEEIEGVAKTYSAVADCCCVPLADAVCGQVPKLFIKVNNPEAFSMDDFREFLKNGLEAARMPAQIEILDQIPRASNGKLQRKKLMQ